MYIPKFSEFEKMPKTKAHVLKPQITNYRFMAAAAAAATVVASTVHISALRYARWMLTMTVSMTCSSELLSTTRASATKAPSVCS